MVNEDVESPSKFVKPADLFKMRRKGASIVTPKRSFPLIANMSSPIRNQLTPNSSQSSPFFSIESQSPLKCLNNLSDPSPTKVPTVLKNPFNSVKRRLKLGSPVKPMPVASNTPKKSRILDVDEDANLEPPRKKTNISKSSGSSSKISPINLTPSNTIVMKARNMEIVHQHPYMSWVKLYPRIIGTHQSSCEQQLKTVQEADRIVLIKKDWNDAFNHLVDLFFKRECPYFYFWADTFIIMFTTSSNCNGEESLQAHIAPLSCSMACQFNRFGIKFSCPTSSTVRIETQAKENSQASFASSQTNSSPITVDSGNGSCKKESDVEDDLDLNDLDEPDHNYNDQWLSQLGLSQQERSNQVFREDAGLKRVYVDPDSNSLRKSSKPKDLVIVEGLDNLKRLVVFIRSSPAYTTSNCGKLANIPPTLLSPCDFWLSTLVVDKNKGLGVNK